MPFLGELAACAGKYNLVWAIWLADDIPEEISYMCWQVELGMSYVAG